MSTLAIVALIVCVYVVLGALVFGLCESASQGDDKLCREGKLPWGS
jgi:hypothetical protein